MAFVSLLRVVVLFIPSTASNSTLARSFAANRTGKPEPAVSLDAPNIPSVAAKLWKAFAGDACESSRDARASSSGRWWSVHRRKGPRSVANGS